MIYRILQKDNVTMDMTDIKKDNNLPLLTTDILKDISLMIKENCEDEKESGLRSGAVISSLIENIYSFPRIDLFKNGKEVAVNLIPEGILDCTEGRVIVVAERGEKIKNFSPDLERPLKF